MVAQAAAKKTVAGLLARTGTEVQVAQPAEVMALLTSTCQGALQAAAVTPWAVRGCRWRAGVRRR
jgi:hypothetical protein